MLVRVTPEGGHRLPPLRWFAPRSASVERERSALHAAPGTASALCGSVRLYPSQDLNRRPGTAHNPLSSVTELRERALLDLADAFGADAEPFAHLGELLGRHIEAEARLHDLALPLGQP